MTVDQAFGLFRSRSEAIGLAVPEAESSGSRAVELTRDGAAIRLRWDEASGALELEITHGPVSGPPAGWLDLYRAELIAGQLRPDHNDFDFESAVDHGLSLLVPYH